MAQIVGERVSKGDAIVNYEDKVFEDIQAEPGEKAYIFMHTVPYEGSVGLVNLLTATRLGRKGRRAIDGQARIRPPARNFRRCRTGSE